MKNILKNKTLWIVVVVVFLVAATAACVGARIAPRGDSFATGLKVGGVEIGKMTAAAAESALRKEMGNSPSGEVKIVLGENEKNVSLDNVDMVYDFEATLEEAYNCGRGDSVFKRISEVLNAALGRVDIAIKVAYDDEMLTQEVRSVMADMGNPITEYTYEIINDSIKITNGMPGDIPDAHIVVSDILEAVGKRETDKPLKFEKVERNPKDVDIDELYDKISVAVCDAKFVIEDGKVAVRDHKVGVEFDKKKAKEIAAANKECGATFEIPATVEFPKLLAEDAKNRIFVDTLGRYTTKYNNGDVSRSSNIVLAAKNANGTILAPGDVFSYNNVVGERTMDTGFKNAKVFMNGETVDGIGGGICQVSTTIYSAALYANLEIVQRINHQLPVSYAPLGQDATVYYGSIDLKLKNNTSYPIKILTRASGGTMYAEIVGYKEDKSQKVNIENLTVSVIEPEITEVLDDTLPEGETMIEKKGTNGAVVDTYKTVTRDGKEPVRTRVSRSMYNPVKKIVHIGTAKSSETTAKNGSNVDDDFGDDNESQAKTTGEPNISASVIQ